MILLPVAPDKVRVRDAADRIANLQSLGVVGGLSSALLGAFADGIGVSDDGFVPMARTYVPSGMSILRWMASYSSGNACIFNNAESTVLSPKAMLDAIPTGESYPIGEHQGTFSFGHNNLVRRIDKLRLTVVKAKYSNELFFDGSVEGPLLYRKLPNRIGIVENNKGQLYNISGELSSSREADFLVKVYTNNFEVTYIAFGRRPLDVGYGSCMIYSFKAKFSLNKDDYKVLSALGIYLMPAQTLLTLTDPHKTQAGNGYFLSHSTTVPSSLERYSSHVLQMKLKDKGYFMPIESGVEYLISDVLFP